MNAFETLVVVHASATWFMTGLAWFVQAVHYPLLELVGQERWVEYERRHVRRTSWIVAPVMTIEALVASLLVLAPALPRGLTVTGLVLLSVVWASTFLLQVPLHERLERGFLADAHRRLVISSWIRTFAWSLRAGVATWLLVTDSH